MSVRIMTGCVVVAGLLFVAGCPQGAKRLSVVPINAEAAGAKAIELYDTNKDGKISGDELNQCPALKEAMPQIDTANTGGITAEMITARIKKWQETKIAVMAFGCRVLRNGQPLVGAEVKLVPERFFSENLPIGSGQTDLDGVVTVIAPNSDPTAPPGVPPCLYRIEITKAGEAIPPKYNTETVFGRDVAPFGAPVRGEIKYNLEY
jgi:hypothetical protein